MNNIPFQSWLNFNPLLPARGKLSTPVNSPHHTGQENVRFVKCSTTARATPATAESGSKNGLKFQIYYVYGFLTKYDGSLNNPLRANGGFLRANSC